ncbi:MAG: transposase [Anaerolineae bacterium]|nr:transposase [Anaerolineae bacterium]
MEMILKNRLNAEDVQEVAERQMREHLSLEIEGTKIRIEMVLNVLLKAAIERQSVEAVCADLEDIVDSNTLREALNEALMVEELRRHEAGFNEALADCVPSEMTRCGLGMAIDLHDEPFYGRSEELRAYTVRGEAREGTTYFWRIATLYVIWRGVRVTPALTYVLPQEKNLDILQRLLNRQADLGFRSKVLYLDKGFCSGQIIAYLQDEVKLPAIIACLIRGKEGKDGARALCRGRKAYRTRYTFTDGATIDLAIVPTLKHNLKTGRAKRTGPVYVVIHLDWSAKKVQQRYRRRFGIESSYRQLGQARAHINSGNPALRFFFLALALLLINIWVCLRCFCSRLITPGLFRLQLNRFRFARFCAFLRRAIEQAYGTAISIPIYSF